MTPLDDGKLREVLTALVEEVRNSKVQISDVLAQRSEYAADIRDLKAAIDTTRRALDPKQLGKHVSDNMDEILGTAAEKFIAGANANTKAASTTTLTANHIKAETQNLQQKIALLDRQASSLDSIAERLEERDARSKWDWAALGCAMIVAAALAGGGAVYFTKQELDTANFNSAIRLIATDSDSYWCDKAQGQIVSSKSGDKHCAIYMPEFLEQQEEPTE